MRNGGSSDRLGDVSYVTLKQRFSPLSTVLRLVRAAFVCEILVQGILLLKQGVQHVITVVQDKP
jgi:hypothetical protein